MIPPFISPISQVPRNVHQEFLRVAAAVRNLNESFNTIVLGNKVYASELLLTTPDGKGTLSLRADYDPVTGEVVLVQTSIKQT